jgi:hypothetical protein
MKNMSTIGQNKTENVHINLTFNKISITIAVISCLYGCNMFFNIVS